MVRSNAYVSYTIKRNIYNSRDYVEVYQCIFSRCKEVFPKKYSPNFNDASAPDGFFSDFLLDSLNFSKVKIKVSPSKADSDIKRLGFRSLFKYVYVNQDDVGSKSFLDLNNWTKSTTNQEVFKYIFNVLDSSITELEADISERTKESSKLLQKYVSVSEFLRETDYDSRESLDDAITNLDQTILALETELSSLNTDMVSNSQRYTELKTIFNEISLNEKRASREILKTREQVEKYSRLKNDYENDIAKINSIIHAQTRIGEDATTANPCPICDTLLASSLVSGHFHQTEKNSLLEEAGSLQKKKKSIQSLIDDLAAKHKDLCKEQAEYTKDLVLAREMIDTESKAMITPYLTQRDVLVKQIASNSQVRSQLVNNIKIRNQQQKIHDAYENLKSAISQLQDKLAELKNSAPSIIDVLSSLADYLKRYLNFVNIKNRYGININPRNFAPVIRDRDYLDITSGGLRTISSIGFMLSLLEYAIDSEINHPRLLMIDTVGKYLGKTTKEKYVIQTSGQEDEKEGISDPLKYQNIYEYIINIANRASLKDAPCQIILVDNDVPEAFVDRYKEFIVAQYSSTGDNGLSVGLIDDIENTKRWPD